MGRSPAVIDKVNSVTKCDLVIDRILSQIIHKKYAPGDKLPPEAKLSEMFGVSRVTIRESFKKLNMMGIITIRQGDGTYVNKVRIDTIMKSLLPVLIFDIDNVDEIYEARRFVETGIVTLAARNRNEKDLALLRQDIQWMDQALIELKTEDFTQRDHEFHYHLAEISRNKVLFNTLNTLMDLLQLYRQHSIHTLDHMRTSNERHHMIYDAINRQDEQCAGQIMGDHILSCKLQVIASLDPDEEPEPGILKIV